MLTRDEREAALSEIRQAAKRIAELKALQEQARAERNAKMLAAERKGIGAGTVAKAGGMNYSGWVQAREKAKRGDRTG
jgi:hypothetical protein